MKRLVKGFLPLALALCGVSGAHAIGDSGGCVTSRLETALKTLGPADVELEMRRWLDDRSRSRGLWARMAQALSPAAEQERITHLIEGVREKDDICAPRALLPIALNHGNVEVVRFLLGKPMGVKPQIPPNILFAYSLCRYEDAFDDAQRARRRHAYALLLDSGEVDVNARSRFGETILQTCFEPELVSLFIEKGARTDVERGQGSSSLNLIEQAMLDALVVSTPAGRPDRRHGLARVKLFSGHLSNSIRGRPVEARMRSQCAWVLQGKRHYAEPCQVLSGLIDASPGTFGD